MQAALNTLAVATPPTNSNDHNETVLTALAAVSVDPAAQWTSGSVKVVLVVTDANYW